MLTPTFYFSRCGVPLKMKKNIGDKIVYQYGSFEPGLDLSRWTIPLKDNFENLKKCQILVFPFLHKLTKNTLAKLA
jgi:hypothetical protein